MGKTLSNNLLAMLFNCFDDIDMSLLDEFENEEDLHSYLYSKYWLDVAEKIEFILYTKDRQNEIKYPS